MSIQEKSFMESIYELLDNSDLPTKLKEHKTEVINLKDEKKHKSIRFQETLLFRVYKKKSYGLKLEFNPRYLEIFNNYKDSINFILNSQKWIILKLNTVEEFLMIKDLVVDIFKEEYMHTHGEQFGCCSHYTTCSDNKICVNKDFRFSLGCYYRLNLLNDKIFYGINKNN
jgi:hypothetical protein